jgi:hypothetical protein
MERKAFSARDELVEKATLEEIVVGDFVRLASGGPLGLVESVGKEQANVVWLTEKRRCSTLPWVCLRVAREGWSH